MNVNNALMVVVMVGKWCGKDLLSEKRTVCVCGGELTAPFKEQS